jgi:ferritin-like metal-binding protein YciE
VRASRLPLGTARTFATLLEDDEASVLLQQTLDEEKEADRKLTVLAEEINANATVSKSIMGERAGKPDKRNAA